jgi:hypothetical protein
MARKVTQKILLKSVIFLTNTVKQQHTRGFTLFYFDLLHKN